MEFSSIAVVIIIIITIVGGSIESNGFSELQIDASNQAAVVSSLAKPVIASAITALRA